VNAARKFVAIPAVWQQRSEQFAQALVAHYACGGSPQSLAVSGGRGAESDFRLQKRGKVGECAVALFFGLDPERAIKWGLAPDHGEDVRLANGLRLDVKTTIASHRYLIWSNAVNDYYHSKRFDVLVSVSIHRFDYSNCWIEGWISKGHFFAAKGVADGSGGLEHGTWYVDKEMLSNIGDLKFLPHVGDAA
jgi:hypothetical protein